MADTESDLRAQLVAAIEAVAEREGWCLLPKAIDEVLGIVGGKATGNEFIVTQKGVVGRAAI